MQETALEPVHPCMNSIRLYRIRQVRPSRSRPHGVVRNAYGAPWTASRRGWIAIALLLRTFSLARTSFVRSRLGACARPRLRAAIVHVSTFRLFD